MISKPKAAWLFGLAAFYCLIAMHIYWPNRGGSGWQRGFLRKSG